MTPSDDLRAELLKYVNDTEPLLRIIDREKKKAIEQFCVLYVRSGMQNGFGIDSEKILSEMFP